MLAASVEQATQNFLEKGEQIAKESQDLKEELVAAVEDVRKQGVYCRKQQQYLSGVSESCIIRIRLGKLVFASTNKCSHKQFRVALDGTISSEVSFP